MSCGEEVPSDTGFFFEQVMVCKDCHVIASRLATRGEQTIQMLRALLRTSIQQAIVTKKLQFHARNLEEAPEVDFLGELMKMVQEVRMAETLEAQEEQGCPSSTSATSTETTAPSASTAAGPPSSDSPSGSTTK